MVTCSNILLFINLFLIIYLVCGDSFKMLLTTCFWLPLMIFYGMIILLDYYAFQQEVSNFLTSFLFPHGAGIIWNSFVTKSLFFLVAASFALFFYLLGKKIFLFIPFSLQTQPQKKKTITVGMISRIILFCAVNYFLIVMISALQEPFAINQGILDGLFKVR